MPGVTPNLPHGLPPEPQVRGVVFLAFTEALHNLHLLADEDMQRFIQDVHYNGWYPFAKQQQVFDLIEARYPLSGPIMEKVGMGFINTIYSFQEWRHLFDTGIGFLKTNEASKLYYNFVQGHPQDIGSFTLIDLRAAEGKAVLHSTTPFSKDMERGILLRGLQLTRSFDYIDVDNAQDERIYHIEFLSATQHPTTPVSTIAASDFVGATHLTASRSLAGAELQKVFWRYKQLAKNLERQQAFWESTNETLVKAFVHLRAQERELQDKNRQLAQAHAASEMLKAGVVDAVPDALITINDASEIVEFSAGAEQIFGYRRADVLGRPISAVIIPPHLRERHWQGMQRYLTTGQATLLGRRVEIEAMRADGSLFPVELTIAAVHLASQRVFTAYVRDITERQRMERALRDSEQRFRGLAEVHPVPVCIVDVEKETFLYVSPCLAQLVGCAVEDLLTRHPGTLFADPTEREVLRLQLRTTGAIEGYEFTLCRADGCPRPGRAVQALALRSNAVRMLSLLPMRRPPPRNLHDVDESRRLPQTLQGRTGSLAPGSYLLPWLSSGTRAAATSVTFLAPSGVKSREGAQEFTVSHARGQEGLAIRLPLHSAVALDFADRELPPRGAGQGSQIELDLLAESLIEHPANGQVIVNALLNVRLTEILRQCRDHQGVEFGVL